MEIVIQIAGSVLILVAFGLAQLGVLDVKSRRYLVLNVVGSTVLAVDAAVGAQWGFLLLEGVWAVVSGVGLVVRAKGSAPGAVLQASISNTVKTSPMARIQRR
jgi:hypothetical protein